MSETKYMLINENLNSPINLETKFQSYSMYIMIIAIGIVLLILFTIINSIYNSYFYTHELMRFKKKIYLLEKKQNKEQNNKLYSQY